MTAAVGALIVALAGTAVSAYGVIQQGKAQNAQAKAQAQINENNAIIAQSNANSIDDSMTRQLRRHRLGMARTIESQRASIAARGLSLDSVSGDDFLTDTQLQSNLMEQDILIQSSNQGIAALQQRSDFLAQGALNRAAGRNAQSSGALAGVGTLLSGAGSATLGYFNKS